jgi:hypothetical protein
MKNIHVLPTENSSRLYKHLGRELKYTSKYFEQIGLLCINQNIYITSDEFRQRMDWIVYKDVITKLEVGDNELFHLGEKIILTTDQDLIKDGVQKIDDEFLEWFVKNPSCEEVEAIYEPKNFLDTKQGWEYTIIIPKEEPDYSALLQPVGTIQETLEEAFEKNAQYLDDFENKNTYEYGFRDGAKWQQERSYSEEDMAQSFMACWIENVPYGIECKVSFNEWFEQFKKK